MHVAPDDPWAGYERLVVTVRRPDDGDLVVCAAPPGDRAPWPWPTPVPRYVLSAWDPGEERPGVEVNRRRQAALETELRPLVTELWAASGVDPVTGAHDEGVAVSGLPERQVLELGARYGQDAVFVWTPASWAIVACSGGRRLDGGWRLRSPDSSP